MVVIKLGKNKKAEIFCIVKNFSFLCSYEEASKSRFPFVVSNEFYFFSGTISSQ